jgi:hypothetical protein
VAGYGLDDRGLAVRVPLGSRMFSSPLRADRFWGSTQHPIPMGTGSISQGVKRPEREADHSPPASIEVKKVWIYTSTPPYAFMA